MGDFIFQTIDFMIDLLLKLKYMLSINQEKCSVKIPEARTTCDKENMLTIV